MQEIFSGKVNFTGEYFLHRYPQRPQTPQNVQAPKFKRHWPTSANSASKEGCNRYKPTINVETPGIQSDTPNNNIQGTNYCKKTRNRAFPAAVPPLPPPTYVTPQYLALLMPAAPTAMKSHYIPSSDRTSTHGGGGCNPTSQPHKFYHIQYTNSDTQNHIDEGMTFPNPSNIFQPTSKLHPLSYTVIT